MSLPAEWEPHWISRNLNRRLVADQQVHEDWCLELLADLAHPRYLFDPRKARFDFERSSDWGFAFTLEGIRPTDEILDAWHTARDSLFCRIAENPPDVIALVGSSAERILPVTFQFSAGEAFQTIPWVSISSRIYKSGRATADSPLDDVRELGDKLSEYNGGSALPAHVLVLDEMVVFGMKAYKLACMMEVLGIPEHHFGVLAALGETPLVSPVGKTDANLAAYLLQFSDAVSFAANSAGARENYVSLHSSDGLNELDETILSVFAAYGRR
ncbi:hypothetical protein M1555_02075 [Patescibacteria group bacterium]|nr:hypothetical protein [Patescibacteria group bacterium]